MERRDEILYTEKYHGIMTAWKRTGSKKGANPLVRSIGSYKYQKTLILTGKQGKLHRQDSQEALRSLK